MALLMHGRRRYTVEDIRQAQRLLAEAHAVYDAIQPPRRGASGDDWDFYSWQKDAASRRIDDAEETLRWVEDRWRWGFCEVGEQSRIVGVGPDTPLPLLAESCPSLGEPTGNFRL